MDNRIARFTILLGRQDKYAGMGTSNIAPFRQRVRDQLVAEGGGSVTLAEAQHKAYLMTKEEIYRRICSE